MTLGTRALVGLAAGLAAVVMASVATSFATGGGRRTLLTPDARPICLGPLTACCS